LEPPYKANSTCAQRFLLQAVRCRAVYNNERQREKENERKKRERNERKRK
jgi:hypothetical protein